MLLTLSNVYEVKGALQYIFQELTNLSNITAGKVTLEGSNVYEST